MTSSSTIVQRLWNYCNVLRDDGMSYGDPLLPAGRWGFEAAAEAGMKAAHERRL